MVSNQLEPPRRYQSGELLNQFQGGEQQMRGSATEVFLFLPMSLLFLLMSLLFLLMSLLLSM